MTSRRRLYLCHCSELLCHLLGVCIYITLLTSTTLFPAVVTSLLPGAHGQPVTSVYNITPRAQPLTIVEFIALLGTEVEEEFELSSLTDNDTIAKPSYWWSLATDYQWSIQYRAEVEDDQPSSFVLCDKTVNITGIVRHSILLDAIAASSTASTPYLSTIYNAEDMTCFTTELYATVAASISDDDDDGGERTLRVHPMLFQMKIPSATIKTLTQLYKTFADSSSSSSNSGSGGVGSGSTMKIPDIDVTFCPGSATNLSSIQSEELISNLTSLLLSRSSETNRSFITESIFWTTVNEEATAPPDIAYKPNRSDFWSDQLSRGIDAGLCDLPFESIMNVTYYPSPCADICSARLTITFNDTAARDLIENTNDMALPESCALALLAGLALYPSICSVSVRPPTVTRNAQAQWLVQTFIENETPWYDVGLNGRGQIVGVSDTGVDVDNCYFWDSQRTLVKDGRIDLNQRKVVQYVPFVNRNDAQLGHGTHVCGTLAGRRATDGQRETTGAADGIAWGAKIAFFDIGDPDEALRTTRELLQVGAPHAKIHSASWGASNANYYGQYAVWFDEYTYNDDEFLIVSAAGNDGSDNAFFTVGDPATSKNVLSVGATNSYGPDLTEEQINSCYVASFSSKGPTGDQRTKPDIIAPGYWIVSAGARPTQEGECDPSDGSVPIPGGSREGLYSSAGTSMATPVVSGTAALVRQYFEEGWYPTGRRNDADGFSPSGALVKAVLMNGAQYVSGVDNGAGYVYPTEPYDNIQNFGLISLMNSLYLVDRSNVQARVWDRIPITDTSGSLTFEVEIDTSNGCAHTQLSATLVWTDPPVPVPGCRRCLLNDLDLRVMENGNDIVYYPNGRSGPDRLNNAERVQIDNVANGDRFTIYVIAHNIDTNPPKAALVVTGCFGGTANDLDSSDAASCERYESESSGLADGAVAFIAIACAICLCATGLVVCRYMERK